MMPLRMEWNDGPIMNTKLRINTGKKLAAVADVSTGFELLLGYNRCTGFRPFSDGAGKVAGHFE